MCPVGRVILGFRVCDNLLGFRVAYLRSKDTTTHCKQQGASGVPAGKIALLDSCRDTQLVICIQSLYFQRTVCNKVYCLICSEVVEGKLDADREVKEEGLEEGKELQKEGADEKAKEKEEARLVSGVQSFGSHGVGLLVSVPHNPDEY